MTKKQKLSEIRFAYLTHNLTLYEALDNAWSEGWLEVVVKYQIDLNNQTNKINKVLETIKELKNGK